MLHEQAAGICVMGERDTGAPGPDRDAAKGADSGDLRLWKSEHEKALHLLERGDVLVARRILTRLAVDAPFAEIREDAKRQLARFGLDWMGWVFFGVTFLVLAYIVFKWVI